MLLNPYACWICAGVYGPEGCPPPCKGTASNVGWATSGAVLSSARGSRSSILGFKQRSVEERQRRDLRVVLELIGESPGWCNGVWLQDGLFNARIGMFQAGPVHPRTRARRNRRDSCEKPALMVVWSRKDWLAAGQGSQQHLTTLSARPDLRRGQGPSVATHTHPHDAGRALTFGTLAASANDAYFGVFPTRGRSEKSSAMNNSLLSERNERKSLPAFFRRLRRPEKRPALKHQGIGTRGRRAVS